jgi:sugar lactone lactonase YvrE
MRSRALLVGVLLACVIVLTVEAFAEDSVRDKVPTGTITKWQISQSFEAKDIDLQSAEYPRFYAIFYAGWETITAETSGLVDISGFRKSSGQGPDCILARTICRSDKKEKIQLSLGYREEAVVFLNGKRVFYGASAPAASTSNQQDSSLPGVVGLKDVVSLDLERGLNEILLMVTGRYGSWAFICKADRELEPPLKDHQRLTKVWETPQIFLTPESVQYDAKRDVLYVTNFDSRYKENAAEDEFTGCISKVKLNGEIADQRWVSGLHAPCGMGIYKDKLYTLERRNLTEIDIHSGKILKRYPVTGSTFLNDIAVDSDGSIYISDTSPVGVDTSRIYRFKDGKIEVWIETDQISRPNGLLINGDKLVVGSTGDGCIKAINLKNKKITTVTCLGAGVLDGIKIDNKGDYLVSHWEGQIYSIPPSGEVTELIDAIGQFNTADFAYLKDKHLLIIPTFVDNRVVAYRLAE